MSSDGRAAQSVGKDKVAHKRDVKVGLAQETLNIFFAIISEPVAVQPDERGDPPHRRFSISGEVRPDADRRTDGMDLRGSFHATNLGSRLQSATDCAKDCRKILHPGIPLARVHSVEALAGLGRHLLNSTEQRGLPVSYVRRPSLERRRRFQEKRDSCSQNSSRCPSGSRTVKAGEPQTGVMGDGFRPASLKCP